MTRDGANNTSSQGGSGPMRGTTRGRARGIQHKQIFIITCMYV